MSLEIHMTRGYCRPGSFIDGTVISILAAETPLYVENYSISLFGRFTTDVAGIDDTRANLAGREKVFFHKMCRLDKEPVTLSGYRMSGWHFHFPEYPVIPGRKREILTHMPKPDPQALPPSGSLGQGANISYSLEVSAFDKTSGRLLEATAPLTFPLTREDETVPATLTVQEEYISGHSNSDSRKMVLECPSAVVQEDPFALLLRLGSETASSTASNPSVIRLLDCQFQLVQKTVVGDAEADDVTWIEEHFLSPHEPTTKLTPINVQAPNAGSILCYPTIPVTIMPTFSCFGIQRSYSFRAHFKVAFDNEVMDHRFAVGEVIVMPKETRKEAYTVEVNLASVNDMFEDEMPAFSMTANYCKP